MNRTCFKSFGGLPEVMIGVALFAAAAVAQNTERVSVDSSGAEANAYSYDAAISADGQFVAL